MASLNVWLDIGPVLVASRRKPTSWILLAARKVLKALEWKQDEDGG